MTQKRKIGLLIIVFVALICIYMWVRAWNQSEQAQANTMIRITDTEGDKIKKIALNIENGELNFEKENGVWYDALDHDIPINQSIMNEIADTVGSISANLNFWDKKKLNYGYMIYIPDTEYGGIIGDMKTITKQNAIKMTGDTWRGMLGKKIIEPPSGKDYLTVSGELNSILRNLIDGRFDGLFLVPQVDTGVIIQNFQFDRYCTLLNGIEDLLASVGYRLDIRHKRGEPGIPGWVELQAVPAKMLKKEYNQDNRINFITRDYRRGINHLICAGTGEGTDRTILHLYVQEDGSVGEKQYYKGIHERTALYSYTSQSDIEQLRKDGTKRLQSLANYKEFEMRIEDADLEIGDIVSGRDYITGILVQKPVVRKILVIRGERMKVEYKLKGDD